MKRFNVVKWFLCSFYRANLCFCAHQSNYKQNQSVVHPGSPRLRRGKGLKVHVAIRSLREQNQVTVWQVTRITQSMIDFKITGTTFYVYIAMRWLGVVKWFLCSYYRAKMYMCAYWCKQNWSVAHPRSPGLRGKGLLLHQLLKEWHQVTVWQVINLKPPIEIGLRWLKCCVSFDSAI